MKEQATRTGLSRCAAMVCAVAVSAVFAMGALAGCVGGTSGASTASAEDNTTKTLVKTATNEMTLVDWDVSEQDSPLTITDSEAKYSAYLDTLRKLTGFNIESITMQVQVKEFAGAEIGATHENVKDNTYTIKSLEAVVDGKNISYTEGDFKKK